MLRAALISLALASPASALDLAQCDRVTHVSYGGAARHMDLGQGRVAWVSWWAQEGAFTDLHVGDCENQRLLTARLREYNITDRAFDRLDDGAEVFDRHSRRAPALFSLEDLAQDLDRVARDTRIEAMTMEHCGCAALYPDARGDLSPFALVEVESLSGDRL